MIPKRLLHPNNDLPNGPYFDPKQNDDPSEKEILLTLIGNHILILNAFKPSMKAKIKIAFLIDFKLDSENINEIHNSLFGLIEEREDTLSGKCNTVSTHPKLIEIFDLIDSKCDEITDLIFNSNNTSYNPGKIFKTIVQLVNLYKKSIDVVEKNIT